MFRKTNKKNNNPSFAAAFPAPYKSQPIIVRKMRYSCTVAGSYTVTRAGMLNWCLGLSTNAGTNFVRLADGVRLTNVQVFGVGSATNSTVTFQWLGPYLPTNEITDSGNPMRPPHISSSPPQHSFGELWSSSGNNETDNLFFVTLNAGDILDLSFQYVQYDGASNAIPNTGGVTTIGIYYGCLGHPGNLLPVALQTANI